MLQATLDLGVPLCRPPPSSRLRSPETRQVTREVTEAAVLSRCGPRVDWKQKPS